MGRRTVDLASEIETWIRELQARLLVATQRDVTFTDALNYLLAMAITRSKQLGDPVLSPAEKAQAMHLMAGKGISSGGIFDYVLTSSNS